MTKVLWISIHLKFYLICHNYSNIIFPLPFLVPDNTTTEKFCLISLSFPEFLHGFF